MDKYLCASSPPFLLSVSLSVAILSSEARSYFFLTNGRMCGRCLFKAGPNILLALLILSMAAKKSSLFDDFRHF